MAVIFAIATLGWDHEYGNQFEQPHNDVGVWLYTANLFLRGILYSSLEYLGITLSKLQPVTWQYRLFSKSFQWLLSAVTAALLWRVFKYMFKHRNSLIVGRPKNQL